MSRGVKDADFERQHERERAPEDGDRGGRHREIESQAEGQPVGKKEDGEVAEPEQADAEKGVLHEQPHEAFAAPVDDIEGFSGLCRDLSFARPHGKAPVTATRVREAMCLCNSAHHNSWSILRIQFANRATSPSGPRTALTHRSAADPAAREPASGPACRAAAGLRVARRASKCRRARPAPGRQR